MTWLLASGPSALRLAGVTRFRHQLQNAVGVINRRRHEFRRLAAGVAEHDALIARALVLVAGGVHALRDIRRLRVQQNLDVRLLPMKAFLLVADVLDRGARPLDQHVLGNSAGAARLARDHDAVGGGERLAGDAHLSRVPAVLRRQPKEGVDHLVGNAVADLVRMAFGDGFAREQVIFAGHGALTP